MQERITCNVIRDLMVLYEDDVCSEDSRRLIDEHLSQCEGCRKLYEQMKEPIPELHRTKTENEVEDKAIHALKKMKKKMTFETMLIMFGVLLVLVIGNYIWKDYIREWVNVVAASEIKVTEIYELENGDIYCTLECEGEFFWDALKTMQVPDDMRREDCSEAWHEVHFQRKFFWERRGDVMTGTVSIIFPKEDVSLIEGLERECSYIQYVGENDRDVLKIWEKGDAIEPASQAIEEKAELSRSGVTYGFPWIVE